MLRLFTILTLLFVFFALSLENPEEKNSETSSSSGLPSNATLRQNRSLLSLISDDDLIKIQSSLETLIRVKRQGRWTSGNRRGQKAPSRERLTPEAKLKKLTDSLFRRVASYRIPKGWALPFCFKDTQLKDDIDEASTVCERVGVDWPCVFGEMAGGDKGFSMNTLKSKFEEVVDENLHRGLQSAIVACEEYWEQYKHEERRRLLLHEIETEVLSRTWVEHGEHIGEPYKPKRDSKNVESVANAAAVLRKALLDAGLADSSVAAANNEAESDAVPKSALSINKRQVGSANVNSATMSASKTARSIRDGYGVCPGGGYSVHPWRKRKSRGSNLCDSLTLNLDGVPVGPERKFMKDFSANRLDFLCSADDHRCRRQSSNFDYERLKEERAKKRKQVAENKELRKKARERINELMNRVDGGGDELRRLLEIATEGPEVESKLGLHLEREERIEEALRLEITSCITEEASKICEPKVMQAISTLM